MVSFRAGFGCTTSGGTCQEPEPVETTPAPAAPPPPPTKPVGDAWGEGREIVVKMVEERWEVKRERITQI